MNQIPIHQTSIFINNEFLPGSKNTFIPIIDPTNEQEICKIDEAVEEDAEKAIVAAENAFKNVWSKTPADERTACILRLADLVEKNRDYFIKLEGWNTGRPKAVNELDFSDSVKFMRFFAGLADKIFGKTFTGIPTHVIYTRKEPIGVVALISPWNFPFMMCIWKMMPAIAAGNCVISKPSEITPLSQLFLGQLIKEAGFPPGVINILPGYGQTVGNYLSHHPRIGKISFTGSTGVGRLIMKASAESNLKKVSLELGGKSPVLVFADADLSKAVEEVFLAAFFNSSQNCICGSRIFVQDTIYDQFLQLYKERTERAKLGGSDDETVELGPIINKLQFERVLNHLQIAKEEGLECLTGGGRHGDKGFFIQPTIFKNVKDTSRLAIEEIFGPVSVVLTPFKTIDEALERANNTVYGLCSGVFSTNINTIERCVRDIQAGTVYVNNYSSYTPAVVFNGYKQSGFGTDCGVEAIEEYLRQKAVYQSVEL